MTLPVSQPSGTRHVCDAYQKEESGSGDANSKAANVVDRVRVLASHYFRTLL